MIIQAKTVKCDELATLLENLKGNFDYLIVSDWREIHFVNFEQRNSVNLSISDSGRAFGEKSELRWRRGEDENYFLCRWISDDGTPPTGDCWKPLSQAELGALEPSEPIGYLLWGEPLCSLRSPTPSAYGGDNPSVWLTENDQLIWYQARIPRKLKYPIDETLANEWKANPKDKTPLVLYVREYNLNGQTMFERFICLGRYT
jgi:hypothetical protein